MKKLLVLFLLLLPFYAFASECPSSPYVYFAEVSDVYDGDTITVDIDLGFHTWRKDEKLRFHGLDAPEVRGKTRLEGLKSRNWLRSQILNKRTMVQTIKSKTSYAGSTATTLL